MGYLNLKLEITEGKYSFTYLIGIASLVQFLFWIRSLIYPRIQIGPDALLFLYSGQVMTRGGLPYQNVWDIKPPVIHEFAAFLALLSGNNPYLLFIMGAIFTSIAFIGVVWLIASLVYEWTNDYQAAIAAGLIPFLFPKFYTFASLGLRPKLFVIVFGILALRLYSQNHHFFGAVLAALSAGLWQFGAFFPLAIFSHALLTKKWRASIYVASGITLTTVVVTSPFILTNTVGIMIHQTVIAPLIITEQLSLSKRLLKGGRLLLFAAPVVIIGAGTALFSTIKKECPWWVGAGMFWFSIQIWLFDLDSTPDLFLGLIFVAFGTGLFVSHIQPHHQRVFLVTLCVIIALMALYRIVTGTFIPVTEYSLEGSDLMYNYWHGVMPDNCHLRLSLPEKKYIEKFGESCSISAFSYF